MEAAVFYINIPTSLLAAPLTVSTFGRIVAERAARPAGQVQRSDETKRFPVH